MNGFLEITTDTVTNWQTDKLTSWYIDTLTNWKETEFMSEEYFA